ncbi:MAG: TolC family protein [Candidatus Riflebacteria bacterium]|nr:TolC family protein [Candidatus Riflebacteria bacterium]
MNARIIYFQVAVFVLLLLTNIQGECQDSPNNLTERKSVTLVDCLQKALQTNPKLLSKMDEREASEKRRTIAESARYPRIKAEETFTRLREPVAFSLPGADTQMSLGDNKIQIKTLRVSQPLYSGGKIENGIRAARSEVHVRQFGELQQREELSRQVTEAYFGVMIAKAFQQVASQALFDTLGHEKQVQTLHEFGAVVRNDILKIQVSVSERRENLIRACNNTNLACTVLSNLVGEEIAPEITFEDFAFSGRPPADENESMAIASTSHPLLQALRETQRLHRFATRAARGDLCPNVGLQWNLTSGSQFNETQSNWDATVYAGFNLFDAGEARTRMKESQANLAKASHDLEGIQRDIILAIRQTNLQMQEAESRLQVAKEAEAQALESMRLTEESFKAGSATSQNLLDEESTLVAAEQRSIAAAFDRKLAETRLWFSMGCLEKALFASTVSATQSAIISPQTNTTRVPGKDHHQ